MKNFSSSYYFAIVLIVAVVIIATFASAAPIFALNEKESNAISEVEKAIEEANSTEIIDITPVETAPAKVKKNTFKTPEVKETVEPSDEESVEIPTEDTTEESIIGNVGLDEKKTETTVESTETVEEAAVYSEVEKEEEVLTTSVSSSVEETVTENPEEVVYEIGEPPIAISEEETPTLSDPIVKYDCFLIIGEESVEEISFNTTCDYFDGSEYWHFDADTNEISKLNATEVDINSYPFVLF